VKWLFPRRPRSPSFKYAAFVSYRHLPDDTRWAEWLIEGAILRHLFRNARLEIGHGAILAREPSYLVSV
jgi:hypothetical protein